MRYWLMSAAVLLVAGCASKPVPAPLVAEAPPPPVAPPPALPPGATPGMLVPTALADGSYPTPNQRISTAAALWHLRAALNVAALSCPAEQGAAITTGYNSMLGAHKAELKVAEASYAAEYRTADADGWRDRYDGAMTRLYNFFSQTPVRPGFCTAASAVTAQLATVPAGGLDAMAQTELAALDQPFVNFYRAYDAWRTATTGQPVIAVAAITSSAQASSDPAPRTPTATPKPVDASKPVATPKPVAAPKPVATLKPVDASKPVATPKPVATAPAIPATAPRLHLDLGSLPDDTLSGS